MKAAPALALTAAILASAAPDTSDNVISTLENNLPSCFDSCLSAAFSANGCADKDYRCLCDKIDPEGNGYITEGQLDGLGECKDAWASCPAGNPGTFGGVLGSICIQATHRSGGYSWGGDNGSSSSSSSSSSDTSKDSGNGNDEGNDGTDDGRGNGRGNGNSNSATTSTTSNPGLGRMSQLSPLQSSIVGALILFLDVVGMY